MRLKHFPIITLIAASVLCSCDDNSTVGSSLVTDHVEIIQDTVFTVTAKSIVNQEIPSRTIVQLLGRLDAKGYGQLSSDIVTQFMPAQYLDFTGIDSLVVDSVRMLMFVRNGEFTGDSLMPMGVKVYRLNKQLPSPIYSNFDPKGYYSDEDLLGETIYTGNTLYSDSLSKLSFQTISVKLDTKFGRDLMKEYRDSSNIFYSPETFANWFPGVYIANSFGNGRVTQITKTRVNLYYRSFEKWVTDSTTRDTVRNRINSCLAVTPEVITNNNLTYRLDQALVDRIDRGEAIIAAPAGADVEITLPLQQILDSYRKKGGDLAVLNSLSISFPVEKLDATYYIEPPTNLLMVLRSKRKDFFADNKLTDNKTSFYATYNATSKTYSFTDMRQYLVDMLDKKEIEPDDYTFVLTPINIEREKNDYTSIITAMTPYITTPALAKINVDDAKIRVIYSKQMIEM